MSPTERQWLSSANPNTGALDKVAAKNAGLALGTMLMIGLIRNDGPSEPHMWDLYITPLGRMALKD